jgi:hypothetical protein
MVVAATLTSNIFSLPYSVTQFAYGCQERIPQYCKTQLSPPTTTEATFNIRIFENDVSGNF